jgi:hypothetical protein
VATRPHGHLEAAIPSEADGRDHVGDPAAAGHDRRPLVVHAVEDRPRVVVSLVGGTEKLTAEGRSELLDRPVVDQDLRLLHRKPPLVASPQRADSTRQIRAGAGVLARTAALV